MADTDINSLSAHHDPPPLDETTIRKLHISDVLRKAFGVKINPREIETRRDEILNLLAKRGFPHNRDLMPKEPSLKYIQENLDRAAKDKKLENVVIGTA